MLHLWMRITAIALILSAAVSLSAADPDPEARLPLWMNRIAQWSFAGFACNGIWTGLVSALGDRAVLWTGQTDWLGVVTKTNGDYRYRTFGEGDQGFIQALLR